MGGEGVRRKVTTETLNAELIGENRKMQSIIYETTSFKKASVANHNFICKLTLEKYYRKKFWRKQLWGKRTINTQVHYYKT